jgi:soluble lytic murein transglycosylase
LSLRLLVLMLSRMGKERLAHVVARTELKRDLSLAPNERSRAIWLAAFPRAYRELIEKRSAEVKLDPDLLQGLIREESAFDPAAGSWAGAMGLCQLMMPTAKQVAHGLKIKGRMTRNRLHEPDLNVRLGSTYLSQLIKHYRGNLALAVASYNAGSGAVSRWLSTSKASELDEFVEEIPIPETRNYVKRVLGSYTAYQLLYGKITPATFLRQDLVAAR